MRKSYNTIIFLDDIRSPLKFLKDIDFHTLIWVKDYHEFKTAVRNVSMQGLYISFDHDLAGTETIEKTGFDCAKWLVDLCIKHEMKFPEYNVHSANPVGAENIIKYIENYKKHERK
jgi:hypothetical protein